MKENKIKINLNSVDKIRKFVQVARRFNSDVDIMTDSREWDAKSILGVFNLDFTKDTYVAIHTGDCEEYKKFVNDMEEFK